MIVHTQILVNFVLNTIDNWGDEGEFWLYDGILKFYDKGDIFRDSYMVEEEVDMDKFFKVMRLLEINIQ